MRAGIFMQPSHAPGTDLYEAIDWSLQVIRWADELGYEEAWIGEHHAYPWAPFPAPDLIVAQGFRETERIRLGQGGYVLPYHHPMAIAGRVAQLDHMSKGRVNFGIAAGSIGTDLAMFGIDAAKGENREMMKESIEAILRYWAADEPYEANLKYWKGGGYPAPAGDGLWEAHLKPVQQPHPPIGVAGLSPSSSTMTWAGEKGFVPMSLNISSEYVAGHWSAYAQGAQAAGLTPDRNDWRVVKETFIASSDAEARKLAVEGGLGEYCRDNLLPLLRFFGFLDFIKVDKNHSDADVDVDYMLEHHYLVGSPETVIRKIDEMREVTGDFGELMLYGMDYRAQPQAWYESMGLLTEQVLPKVSS